MHVERRGPVAWLTPQGWAAEIGLDELLSLADTLSALADDGTTRVVALTGAFHRAWVGVAAADARAVGALSATMQRIAEAPLPLIAAIDSTALDAGLELALACDIRLAAIEVRFGFTGAETGRLPLAGGGVRLARIAGRATALQLLLSGETLGPGEALSRGLVSGVYPRDQLAAVTDRLATVIAGRGPIAVRYAKEAVARGADLPLDAALRFETDLTVILQSTADRAEGVRAFTEKRPPTFTGS
ncbi:MAG: enoyl-CoA hydratase-related protein [Dehalococcoidia bacterium]